MRVFIQRLLRRLASRNARSVSDDDVVTPHIILILRLNHEIASP